METIFWVLVVIIIYVYFGYPVVLILWGFLKGSEPIKKGDSLPKVTLIITAHNEGKIIRRKIENTLSLDYPKEKLEVIVASDGSTDETDEIVAQYASRGVRLEHLPGRKGKTATQNHAVLKSSGEVIVFSDANAMYERAAIKKLVRNFDDNRVGCVCGELKYTNSSESVAASGENLYWKYEKFLKRKESHISSLLGVTGSIYAVRRALYVPLKQDIISDFVEPLEIVRNRHKIVYEPEAISFEKASVDMKTEFKRKTRIVTRSIRGLFNERELLNPFKYGIFSIQLISHKLLRWAVPLFLIGLFVSNLFLSDNGNIYRILLIFQIVFYLSALVGWFFELIGSKIKLFYIPYYFCMVNLAALIGWFKCLAGQKEVIWETTRK